MIVVYDGKLIMNKVTRGFDVTLLAPQVADAKFLTWGTESLVFVN